MCIISSLLTRRKMYILLCLTFILSITTGRSNIRPMNTSRLKIINGREIHIRQRPFMASLHLQNNFICGGTIISASWVLTAQHCMSHSLMGEWVLQYYQVRAGSTYHNQGYIHRLSKIALINPEKKFPLGGIPLNDVALIKVKTKFQFGLTVKPAKLPKDYDKIPNTLWASGWGLTEKNELSRKLRIVNVNKVPFNDCQNLSVYAGILVSDQHLCFGGQGFDSCRGDSGGPLGNYDTVYGIASFGATDCGELPGVYESVSYYSDWIEFTTQT